MPDNVTGDATAVSENNENKKKDEVSFWVSARKEKSMHKILGEIKRKLDSGDKEKQGTLF